jgi:hypothetical protein
VGVVLCLASLSACAFDGRSEWYANTSLSKQVPTAITAAESYTWQNPNVRARGSLALAGPNGARLASELDVFVGARAVGTIAARVLPLVGTALLIYEVYDALRVRPSPGGGGGIEWDSGVEPVTDNTVQFDLPLFDFYGNATQVPAYGHAAACSRVAQNTRNILSYQAQGGSFTSVRVTNCTATGVSVAIGLVITQTNNPCNGTNCTTTQYQNSTASGVVGTGRICAPRPGVSGGVIGVDGKCPSGTYQPVTPEQAAEFLVGAPVGSLQVDYAGMLREAAGLGPQTLPGTGVTAEIVPTNPAPHVNGQTTSTTDSDGVVTETATGWDFSRDPLRKDQGQWTQTTTTTRRDRNGNPLPGGGTTTTAPPQIAPGTTPAPEAGADPCAADPGRLGCIGLGTAPTDRVPTETRALAWQAEDVNLASACPAPITLPQGNVLSFQPTCDAFTSARPVVLAAAAFTALMIVVFALRGGSA